MKRKKLERPELMRVTEKLLLEQGYGGFNFSALSTLLEIGRSTLYEYYASKDDLIADYMNELMVNYTDELSTIVAHKDAKEQLLKLIELMIKYTHIHSILRIIPLLQSDSDVVTKMKQTFIEDHLHIIKKIIDIVENGKQANVIREEIPTDVLVNLLFNTINKPTSLKMDNQAWAKWVWEIIYIGIEPKGN
ncbi:TetR/AcrR family transcriptional regulator [Sporosarcina limicola]|uniref:AcrR family transcriptional regulator n=1 Tax=Sporosarcina limicola TaxID=34101 RepID=A0A927R723_9BACL|nr:TetR/AcrR family transcriptional regulator [Sporosarcina limicola]MBE1555524.1 AcrR family transcriptional regulator [Sporosarcina limicola]